MPSDQPDTQPPPCVRAYSLSRHSATSASSIRGHPTSVRSGLWSSPTVARHNDGCQTSEDAWAASAVAGSKGGAGRRASGRMDRLRSKSVLDLSASATTGRQWASVPRGGQLVYKAVYTSPPGFLLGGCCPLGGVCTLAVHCQAMNRAVDRRTAGGVRCPPPAPATGKAFRPTPEQTRRPPRHLILGDLAPSLATRSTHARRASVARSRGGRRRDGRQRQQRPS
jgi:hypothetical protein